MNEITKLFENIPDEILSDCIREIKETDKTGYIKENGLIHQYAAEVRRLTGEALTIDIYHTTVNILKQAAYRWESNRK